MQSPGTRGPLSAPLAGAGKGTAAEFRATNARGRIALVERGGLRFGEKVENAADTGAIGVLIYNNAPGLTSGTLGGAGRIPAAMISQEDGHQLLSLLRSGAVTASMNLDVVSETRMTNNVIATLGGRTPRRLVIGAHFDSVPGSPGANDNASGVAAMLEAAHQLRGIVPELTVEFLAFGAEELGLLGSEHYVRSERAGTIAGMINADMVGVGDRFLLGNSGGDLRLFDFATERARAIGLSFSTTRTGASDHEAFERIGIPAVFLHWSPDPAYHTPQDIADRVLADRLDAAIQVIVQVARSRIPSL
ncbi:MAG: M20/M25/M40 family metallo-hydrolase [Armatimonadetes bacterium]|nr:M20/M25/M40 family metallo-hydrolase [Armatimonadota bacterium]